LEPPKFFIVFRSALVPPHFQKGAATHAKEIVQMRISNDKSLTTSTRIFYKIISASLDCISISDLCSAKTQLQLFMKTLHHSI